MISDFEQVGVYQGQWLSRCGMQLAYQQWGERKVNGNQQPLIVALHGWLDNSASFHRLAPLLVEQGYCVLGLDLPGHGHSDARHRQGTYNIYDDIRQLVAWIESLEVDSVVLIGHSRGAMISLLLAASFPELICEVVFLDGMMPPPVPGEEAPEQLAKHVRDFNRQRRQPLGYDSEEQALKTRMKATSMSLETSAAITARALYQGDDKRWYWRSDPRLRAASAIRLNQDLNDGFINALKQPALLLLAKQGFANYPEFVASMARYPHIQQQTLEGGHHFHLEPVVVEIAAAIVSFLNKNKAMFSA